MYRRACAYEALSNTKKCQDDINQILLLDPKNQLAIKTNERLQKIVQPTTTTTTTSTKQKKSAPPIPTPSDETSDWGLEVMKKVALKHLENGKLENAINVLEKALNNSSSTTTDPDQILSIRQLLASTYSSIENHEKSFEISELILTKDPNNFKALLRASDSALHLVSNFFK